MNRTGNHNLSSGLESGNDMRVDFLTKHRTWRLIMLVLLFTGAFLVRMYRITEPPLDFHPIRQYRSALIARWFLYQDLETVAPWKQEIASLNHPPILEPPVVELIASAAYRITGSEELWIPRVISVWYWLLGGVFLYLIAKRTGTALSALIVLAIYLFLPFGIFAGRSFQPDVMMLMLVLGAMLAVWCYVERSTVFRLVIAALVSGCALFIKPSCVFMVLATYFFVVGGSFGWRRLFNRYLLLFLALSFIPAAVYYGRGIFASDSIGAQPQLQFVPRLIFNCSYWSGWLRQIGNTVGTLNLVVALVGMVVLVGRLNKLFLAGLWLSYLIYGLVFSYAIHTHDYYQLLLIPIVSLSLGPIAVWGLQRLRNLSPAARRMLAGICLAVVTSLGIIALSPPESSIKNLLPQSARAALGEVFYLFGSAPKYVKNIHTDFSAQARQFEEMGAIVNHSSRCILLMKGQERTIRYHGEMHGVSWPTGRFSHPNFTNELLLLPAEELFKHYQAEYIPEYFIITNFEELQRQPELEQLLTHRFAVLARTEQYLIFDLRKMLTENQNSSDNKGIMNHR
jgi:hypothetical protein